MCLTQASGFGKESGNSQYLHLTPRCIGRETSALIPSACQRDYMRLYFEIVEIYICGYAIRIRRGGKGEKQLISFQPNFVGFLHTFALAFRFLRGTVSRDQLWTITYFNRKMSVKKQIMCWSSRAGVGCERNKELTGRGLAAIEPRIERKRELPKTGQGMKREKQLHFIPNIEKWEKSSKLGNPDLALLSTLEFRAAGW